MKLIALLPVLIVFSGCGGPAQPVADAGADRLACAIGRATEFGPDCRVERVAVDGATQLVVRHPDGSFRRFAVLPGGAGLAVVDGADEAVQALDGDVLAVTVARDRYRFPARQVAGDAGRE